MYSITIVIYYLYHIKVERTRLDEDALRDRHDSWNEVSETLDSKRLSLILEIDEPEDVIMEQKVT